MILHCFTSTHQHARDDGPHSEHSSQRWQARNKASCWGVIVEQSCSGRLSDRDRSSKNSKKSWDDGENR